jgi:hypothetical protein
MARGVSAVELLVARCAGLDVAKDEMVAVAHLEQLEAAIASMADLTHLRLLDSTTFRSGVVVLVHGRN